MRELFEKTDWRLLAEQKRALLRAINILPDPDKTRLEGILALVDAYQDTAAAAGFPVIWSDEVPDALPPGYTTDAGVLVLPASAIVEG